MSIINANHISQLITASMPEIAVRHASGELAFMADHQRVTELCAVQQVVGLCRGKKLRYLELIVPIEETARPRRERSRGGMVAEDSRTVNCEGALVEHDFAVCATYGTTLKTLIAGPLRQTSTSVLQAAFRACSGV